MGANEMAWE